MVLVVGGAGFIGSHTVKALAASGEEVVVFDSLETGHRDSVSGHRFVRGDLRDSAAVASVLSEFAFETVFHFAASIEVGESVTDPGKYYQNNVVGTLNLVQSMVRCGVKRLVFSSTAGVYGEPHTVPIPEDHPKNPTSPYGRSKLTVEHMLQDFHTAHGIDSVALRYFNAAGCDPDGVLGEDHRPESHLVPRLLRFARGLDSFQIFGDDYDTPDGTCVRDYVHVSDLADAHLLAAKSLASRSGFRAYNLGNGDGYSVRDVVQAVRDVTGKAVDPPVGPRRAGDPAKLVASAERARTELGWVPRHPSIREMVEHAWRWQSAHPQGYAD